MKQTIETVEAVNIIPGGALDPIRVHWDNVGVGQGYVTILCYGSAWTAYFGGMVRETIQQFFARADTGYLVTTLGITPQLKATKRDHAYLARIIEAIKLATKLESV